VTNRNEEFEKARLQMQNAQRGAPQPVEDEVAVPASPARFVAPGASPQPVSQVADASSAGEMTVVDFLQAASQSKFVDKVWASKGKRVKIKKFTKGELDRISSPLFKRTMKLDLSKMGGGKDSAMNVDISMDLFMEMEKILVEVGMSYYTDNRGQQVITREYIDNVMTDEDFKELATIIKEVNPKALVAGIESQQEVAETKKS
jgi:hypothetical protein